MTSAASRRADALEVVLAKENHRMSFWIRRSIDRDLNVSSNLSLIYGVVSGLTNSNCSRGGAFLRIRALRFFSVLDSLRLLSLDSSQAHVSFGFPLRSRSASCLVTGTHEGNESLQCWCPVCLIHPPPPAAICAKHPDPSHRDILSTSAG
jgi:hypothetical protein